jgi:hypothetical protein
MSCGDGLLKRAFVGDMRLAAYVGLDLESPGGRRCRACHTWSSASLRGGPSGNYIRIYLDRVLSGLRTNPPTLTAPQSPLHSARVLDALQHAFSAHMAVARQTAGEFGPSDGPNSHPTRSQLLL